MKRPCVLVFGGLDPSGGAGLAADITAVAALGAHTLPIITTLTAQDHNHVESIEAISSTWLRRQAQAVIKSIPIAAIKLGVLGSLENAQTIAELVIKLRETHPNLPLVLDPVLASNQGDALSNTDARDFIFLLLPLCTIITPNLPEAEKLCPDKIGLEEKANSFLNQGCQHVLIKGGHSLTNQIENHLYSHNTPICSWRWPRQHGSFHGSGCTLAANIAANLAKGLDVNESVENAQIVCQRALATSYAISRGQRIPNRIS